MSDAAVRARAIATFESLADLPETERDAELAALRAKDAALAGAVEALFAADEAAGESFLTGGVAEFAPSLVGDAVERADPSPSESARAGDRVGAYRLRALLGRGGMGEVWEAERADGEFEQVVAMKLVKRGMDSEEVLSRFRRERQILARLDHPGIARLLDGGIAADGRPYFVLERVEGRPITAWCAGRASPVAARLRLVVEVAEAVAAAHRNLVVHRDLKPSNILVDNAGRVKLLDFGIAKLLSDDGEPGARTELGDRALTPSYAAPEQIRGEPVTTATDVYALGVVLYELLTGRLPHRRDATSAVALAEQLERETLTRPSRAAALADAEPATGDPSLPSPRELVGDLDTIVLKALARDPARRYPTMSAFADDLARHLDGRPVHARPDSRIYRLRKFVGRHRVGVALATAAFVALVAALSLALFQGRRATSAARAAGENALRAERVKEFLIRLFESADPESPNADLTAREILGEAGERLERELAGEPLIRADLLEAVARIDRNLGLFDSAAKLAGRSLELRSAELPADDPAVASARATVGSVHLSQGEVDVALAELGAALAALEKVEPPESLLLARVRSDYADVLFWKGRAEESERIERLAYEAYRDAFGPDDLQVANHLRNLAVILDELDRLDESEAAYRESQAVIERKLGEDHPSAASSYQNLAVLLERRGRIDEAERLLRKALAIRREKLGPAHLETGHALQLWALFLLHRERYDESEAAYREARDLFSAINPRHFEVGKCDNGLALLAGKRGDHAAAEQLLAGVVDLFREQLGPEHPFVAQADGNRAFQIAAQGRWAEAETIQRRVLAALEASTGAESEEVGVALTRLAATLSALGRVDEAAGLTARSAAIDAKIHGAT